MKKISICIPTYNRSNHVISQLNFLENEVGPFKDLIEIIVADNLSTIEHRDKLVSYHKEKKFFDLKLNQHNLGSIGNIYHLLDSVKNSDYVWFVGDDDILLEGIIKRVVKILNDKKPVSYIFLNYDTFVKDPNIIRHKVNLLGYSGYIDKGEQCVMDLFQENGSVNMFITSCIYETQPLKAFYSSRPKQLLIDPLLFSFTLAHGPIYIEKDVFVLGRGDAPSWSKEALAIFSWQIQGGLIELLDHSYAKKDVIKMMKSMYESGRGSYLRMLLKAPFEYKKSIIGMLGFEQVKFLIRLSKNYIFRKMDKMLHVKQTKTNKIEIIQT